MNPLLICERDVECPNCNASTRINVAQYISVAEHPEIATEFINGALGKSLCASCGNVWESWAPMLFVDEEAGLLMYVCREDHANLREEYHEYIAGLGPSLDQEVANRALSGPYSIVSNAEACRITARAARNGTYLYRTEPGTQRPEFDVTVLGFAAREYRLAGQPEEAYRAISCGTEFETTDPGFWREVGAYAYAIGRIQESESAFARYQQYIKIFEHLPIQVFPQEGVISSMPPGADLPILMEQVRSEIESQRPELRMSKPASARLAGVIVREMEKALVVLPSASAELFQFRNLTASSFAKFAHEDPGLWAIYDSIVSEFRAELSTVSDDGTLLRIGSVYREAEKHLAEAALTKAEASNVPDIKFEAALALGEINIDNKDLAKQKFETCLASTKASILAKAYFMLGYLALGENHTDEARDHLSESINMGAADTSPRALYLLAFIAAHDGDTQEEIELLAKATEYKDDYTKSLAGMRLGEIYFSMDDLQNALHYFRMSDASPEITVRMKSWYYVAVILEKMGDLTETRRLMRQLAAIPLVGESELAAQWFRDRGETPPTSAKSRADHETNSES